MQTDANAFVLPPLTPSAVSTSPKRRKSFYTQEEDIEIKPSTELIPDEYEHSANNDVLLHIFRSSIEVDLADELVDTLEKIDYQIDYEKNVHELNTREEFLTDLENIKKSSFEKSALFLVFVGFFDTDSEYGSLLMMKEKEKTSVSINQIWNLFSANNCPELKNKPKIFLFCTSPEPPAGIQTDSVRHYTVESEQVYDFPDESDILIVYKQINESFSSQKAHFLIQLCKNILSYSKKYDIIDLVSYLSDTKHAPVIVSTLTRKFYLTPNSDREHYLSLIENYNYLEDTLQKLQDDLEKLTEIQKKKKDKKFMSFSFRKKTDEKPKIVKKDDQSKNLKVDSPRTSKTSVPTSPSPRTKLGAAPPAVRRRSKQASESDSGNVKNKPIWKN